MKRMKRKTRLLSIMLVTAFFVSGCGLIGSPPDKRSPTIHNSQTVSIVISNLGMTFPSGMDENDNRYLNYIEEETGLEIQVTTPPPEVYNEKLDVIMSSGNLPDMMHDPKKQLRVQLLFFKINHCEKGGIVMNKNFRRRLASLLSLTLILSLVTPWGSDVSAQTSGTPQPESISLVSQDGQQQLMLTDINADENILAQKSDYLAVFTSGARVTDDVYDEQVFIKTHEQRKLFRVWENLISYRFHRCRFYTTKT